MSSSQITVRNVDPELSRRLKTLSAERGESLNSTVLHFLRAAVVVVPIVVIGELQAGFEMGRRALENQRMLAEFLDEPFVSTWSVTTTTTAHYARIFARLREAGTPIPINDVWIAATTMECNGHLLTFDGDFSRVEGLDQSTLESA